MRLLVLGCSQRKKPGAGALPALERYDGVLFRVLRKWQAKAASSDLHGVIISAKYGLLGTSDLILDYDQRMTAARAEQLRDDVNMCFREQLDSVRPQAVFLGLSGLYKAIVDTKLLDRADVSVEWVSGSIGAQAAQLKHWLWHDTIEARDEDFEISSSSLAHNPSGTARLRGVELSFTSEEVVARARSSLAIDGAVATNFVSWYVLIDKQPVSAKWLVHILSGLPVGAFSTSEACRVLAQLGVAVHANKGPIPAAVSRGEL